MSLEEYIIEPENLILVKCEHCKQEMWMNKFRLHPLICCSNGFEHEIRNINSLNKEYGQRKITYFDEQGIGIAAVVEFLVKE